MSPLRWLGLGLLLLLPAAADSIEFSNGDRLSGQVKQLVNGQLTVTGTVAGTVQCPLGQVRGLTTAGEVTVVTASGRQQARLEAAPEGRLKLIGGAGELLLPLGELVALNPPPPTVAPSVRWSGLINTGLGSRRGNVEADNLDFSLRLQRDGRRADLTFTGGYRLDRQRDPASGARVTAEDSWNAALRLDYFWSPSWFYFANAQARGDRAKNINHRVQSVFGAGYRLQPSKHFTFRADLGITWLLEDYADNRGRKEEATASLAYHLERRLFQRVQLVHGTAWYPSLDNIQNFLVTSDAAVRYYFTDRIFLGLNADLDYESHPPTGTRPYTLKYGAGLGVAF
ncbi:MAG: DUF481 domain-containing protein [Fimbriimonadaceae bacterium]|nr:DUF481 domain-containing protein [Fimbriimonadaceae bacterium]